jgi:beta-lysine 5,6-aminomutase beta subunit
VLLLFGGPRIDHKLALELGFDAGFGPGTKPSDVASYLVEHLCPDPAAGREHPRDPRDAG